MINSGDFAKRLQKIIDYYSESASSFSEKIGVQRSSISHILSGRNKPSLDFVLKVLATFPEVELYWLLNGKGSFPSHQKPIEENHEKLPTYKKMPLSHKTQEADQTIDKIVIFYSDGTFKEFLQR